MTKDKKRFTLRMPDDLYNRLEKEANSRGISLNSLILVILDQYTKQTA